MTTTVSALCLAVLAVTVPAVCGAPGTAEEHPEPTAAGGTIPRLVGRIGPGRVPLGPYRNRAPDSVSVKDFGAAGDGFTDDTAAVQAALDAGAGGMVLAPRGTYLTRTLTMPNNTRLVGAGMRLTVFRLKAGTNADLLTHSGSGGSHASIESLTLDGNYVGNPVGRSLYWITDDGTDGPALTLRDVVLTGGAGDERGNSSFVSGLAWVHWENVRFIDNRGSLWLGTNDSTFLSLFVGNSGVVLDKPGVVVGGGNNQFISSYFGGNGAYTKSTAPQVLLWGAPGNWFIGCVNDSANGHGYEFQDYETTYSVNNQIIGGYITNPGQHRSNTYSHVLFLGHSQRNQIIGVRFDNTKGSVGKYAVGEAEFAGNNLVVGATFGTFGTQPLALIPGNGTSVDGYTGLRAGANDVGASQAGRIYQGRGTPDNARGSDGDVYFRTDAPSSPNQRFYIKSAGQWTGIL
jgi:Pectate lyase superfamily protein